MAARILEGTVFDVLPTIPAGSVDCVVSSPPYWMLRSYLPKGHPLKPLELGNEPTPREYVENQVRALRLVRDCLADHGTVWLNVGDSYARGNGSKNGQATAGPKQQTNRGAMADARPGGRVGGLGEGSLCLIPQRLAVALQDDGWIVRSVVVWHKPAPMPASLSGWAWRRCRVKVSSKDLSKVNGQKSDVSSGPPHKGLAGHSGGAGIYIPAAEWSDCPGCPKCSPHGGYVLRRGSWRPTSSWEPVLMLAKSSRYFADGIAVKQPPASATVSRDQYTRVLDDPDEQFAVKHDHETVCDGANLRDVWTIAAEPLREKHYAAFPTELVHRCLKAGTSAKGYCKACGSPWVRVVEQVDTGKKQKMADGWDTGPGAHGSIHRNGREQGEPGQAVMAAKTVDWWPSCSCPDAEPRPGLVLDLFAGSGRTGIEAMRLGLDFVGCELNPEYAEMARRLLRAESPLFSEP